MLFTRLDRYRDRSDGFTLIELLIVVLIIGILAAIAIPVYLGLQNQAKNSSTKQDVNSSVNSIQVALTEGQTVADAATANTDSANRSDGTKVVTTIQSDGKNFTVVGTQKDTNYTYTYDSTTGKFTDGTADVVLGGGNQTLATPAASFTVTANALTITLDPSATTNASGTNPYYWDYGDGNAARETGTGTQTYTYTAAGTYTVTLTARNTVAGPTNSTTRTITVSNGAYMSTFETDNTATTNMWANSGYTSPNYASTAQVYAGSYSMYIPVTSGKGLNTATFTPTPNLTVGKTYTVSVWLYNAGTTKAQLQLYTGGGSGTATLYSSTKTNTWEQVTGTVTVTGDGGNPAFARILSGSTNGVYVDNLTVTPN